MTEYLYGSEDACTVTARPVCGQMGMAVSLVISFQEEGFFFFGNEMGLALDSANAETFLISNLQLQVRACKRNYGG